MNILQVQDDLKNFSQQQLVQEMKQPKGVAPQFLVLGEITRRKRMSDDMKTRGATDQNTVAQDVVSAAGVPQGGLAQMAQAMAPKSSIEPNMQPQGQAQPQAPMPMASGGILSLAGGGGKTKREKAFFLEFPKNSPIFAGERRYVTANTLEQLESSMPLFFKRMRSRGVIISNENAPEAFQETATKLAPAQLNIAVRRGKESIAQAEEAARIAGLQAETGATNDQTVTSAGRPTESKVIDDVQSLDAPVAEPSEYDIQQDSDIEGDLLMADDYEKAEKERLRQEALATGLVPSETTDMIRNQETGVRPFSGSAFPNLADERPYPDRVKPTFNARSDEAAAASLAEIERLNAFNEERKRNALAYKEGRTPAQEKLIEDARGKARDSAITALGEIDRSPDPYEDDVVIPQDAMDYFNAINADTSDPSKTKKMADDYLRGRGDLQAPSSIGGGAEAQMLAEGRPMTEAEYFASVIAAQDQQSRFADAASAAENSRKLMAERGMLKSQRENMASILSGGPQGMNFNANLASPELDKSVARGISVQNKQSEAKALEDYANRVTAGQNPRGPSASELQDYIAEQQLKINEESRLPSVDRNLLSAEDYDAMAVQKANQESANQARELQSALSADVDVRDAGLGGAFAKGDEGIERRFLGLGPFEDSTSEIIQDQLDKNKAADERQKRNDDLMITGRSSGYGDEDQALANEQAQFNIVDPYAADRAAIASSDTILNDNNQNDIGYLDNRLEGARAVLARDGNIYTPGRQLPFQSYDSQTYEESPSVTMPYYEKPTMRETGEYGPMIGGAQGRTNIMMQGDAEKIAFEGKDENLLGFGGVDSDPTMFGDAGPISVQKDIGYRSPSEVLADLDSNLANNKDLSPEEKEAYTTQRNALEIAINTGQAIDNTVGDAVALLGRGLLSSAEFVNEGVNVAFPKVGAKNIKTLQKGQDFLSGLAKDGFVTSGTPSEAGSAGEGTTDQAGEAGKTDPVVEANVNPEDAFNAVVTDTSESSIITEMDEQAALDSQSNAAFEAERQRQIAAKNKGSSKGTGGTGSSASSQILDLLKSQEANADSDKWMALANAGMALMSSKQPTLGGALGEAGQVGIAGLMKSRQAGDAAKLKTLKFQAGIEAAAAKAGKSGLSSSNMVSLINSLSGDNARIATEIAKLEAKSTDGMSLEPQDDAYLKSLRLMLTSNLVDIQGYRRQAGLAALPKTQDVRTATS